MRIVLILEYDGSSYCGWQSQPERCSIQDQLESALSRIAQETIRVTTAGRTDTGVHAFYQVVHFDTAATRPVTAWVRGTNAFLPHDISVLWASIISEEFHARYSAYERRYQYYLLNRPVRPGCHHQKVGWFHEALDLSSMQIAAKKLIGEHDFQPFVLQNVNQNQPYENCRDWIYRVMVIYCYLILRLMRFCIIWCVILLVALST